MSTYRVRRFYFNEDHPDHRKVVAEGLTLAQAQAHCQDDSTRELNPDGTVKWFDGYDQEAQ